MGKMLGLAVSLILGLSLANAAWAKGTTKGVRPKHLNGEAQQQGTTINFQDGIIDGTHKSPSLSTVAAGHAEKNYDFVKVRLGWHPEMLQSAAQLD